MPMHTRSAAKPVADIARQATVTVEPKAAATNAAYPQQNIARCDDGSVEILDTTSSPRADSVIARRTIDSLLKPIPDLAIANEHATESQQRYWSPDGSEITHSTADDGGSDTSEEDNTFEAAERLISAMCMPNSFRLLEEEGDNDAVGASVSPVNSSEEIAPSAEPAAVTGLTTERGDGDAGMHDPTVAQEDDDVAVEDSTLSRDHGAEIRGAATRRLVIDEDGNLDEVMDEGNNLLTYDLGDGIVVKHRGLP